LNEGENEFELNEIFYNFETHKKYKIYKPQNNYDEVIQRIRNNQRKKYKELQEKALKLKLISPNRRR
jgi:hypothetical protein